MRIKIKEKEWKTSKSIEQIMSDIDIYLQENNLLLNSMVINGEEIQDNFENKLSEVNCVDAIVEVIAYTYDEIMNYLKKEFENEAENLQLEAERLSANFYALNTNTQNNKDLSDLLERAHRFYQIVSETVSGQFEQWKINTDFFEKFPELVNSFFKALEERDNIYIADLLHFELVPKLENIFFN